MIKFTQLLFSHIFNDNPFSNFICLHHIVKEGKETYSTGKVDNVSSIIAVHSLPWKDACLQSRYLALAVAWGLVPRSLPATSLSDTVHVLGICRLHTSLSGVLIK
jgi:hypothetical protein